MSSLGEILENWTCSILFSIGDGYIMTLLVLQGVMEHFIAKTSDTKSTEMVLYCLLLATYFVSSPICLSIASISACAIIAGLFVSAEIHQCDGVQ